MIKIQLVIEDEKLNKKIVGALTAAGYEIDIIDDPYQADPTADIILLDPEVSAACSWTAEIKNTDETSDLLLIGLIGATRCEDEVINLLDDIVLLPLRDDELIVRIKRLLGRTGKKTDNNLIRAGSLIIDLDSYEVTVDGQLVQLTFKEFELLKFLAANPGRVYNRQILLNQIWEYDYYGGSRTVDVHVRRLRAKLGSKYGSMIQTVRHVGYRFSTT